jgi:predicted transcriptional regulator of viral defense system
MRRDSVKERFIANCGFLRTKELVSRGEWRELRKLLDNNTIIKVKNGLYRLNDAGYNQHVEAAKIVPDGVFCLFTAWQYYNLSVYNPFEFYMAIKKNKKLNCLFTRL